MTNPLVATAGTVSSYYFLWLAVVVVVVSAQQPTPTPQPITNTTATVGNCVAGGSGHGLYFDYTRGADVVSLRWDNIPRDTLTVEVWFKNTDTFLNEVSLLSYSAFNVYGYNSSGKVLQTQQQPLHSVQTNGSNTSTTIIEEDEEDDYDLLHTTIEEASALQPPPPPYEAANELSLRISRQRWVLWRGGQSECELTSDVNPKIEASYMDGQWHHYAFSIDASAQTASLYLDGEHLDFGTTLLDGVDFHQLVEEDESHHLCHKANYSSDWDVAESPDALEYYGKDMETKVVYVENPCDRDSYTVRCIILVMTVVDDFINPHHFLLLALFYRFRPLLIFIVTGLRLLS